MSQNPTNATYWKKQAEEARTLAREASEALEVCDCVDVNCPNALGDHEDDFYCIRCTVIAKLRAAGILKGGK